MATRVPDGCTADVVGSVFVEAEARLVAKLYRCLVQYVLGYRTLEAFDDPLLNLSIGSVADVEKDVVAGVV